MENTKWTIDPGHTKVQFKVKHLGIANVVGTFKLFKGSVENAGPSFEDADVIFEMDAASIDTNNPERDGHLRSNLFLDAENHPAITYSGKISGEQGELKLVGNLTILGTTRPVSLDLEFTGTGAGRFNDIRAGFEISGKIQRKEFGLNFNLMNDLGNLVVGEEIKILGDIELIRN